MSEAVEEGVFFDAVVVGSGFGGTIAALTLTNYFKGNTSVQDAATKAAQAANAELAK